MIRLLKGLRTNKGFYYQTRHFTAVSGLLYRVKQNAVGLANIYILACMVLVTVSGTLCLYLSAEKALDSRYPDDILVTQMLKDGADPAATMELVQKTVADSGRQMQNFRYETFFLANYSGNTLLSDLDRSGTATEVTFLTTTEYQRLTGKTADLGENEVLVCTEGLTLPDNFYFENILLHVKARLDTFPAGSITSDGTEDIAVEFYTMYGGFLFLGIFLGLLFLLATVLIIYYKQVSEGYEDQRDSIS